MRVEGLHSVIADLQDDAPVLVLTTDGLTEADVIWDYVVESGNGWVETFAGAPECMRAVVIDVLPMGGANRGWAVRRLSRAQGEEPATIEARYGEVLDVLFGSGVDWVERSSPNRLNAAEGGE